MTLIDKSGERPACDRCHRVRVRDIRRGICAGCRELVTDAETERRIILALGSGAEYGERYSNIAAALGIPRRRVQQTVGRLMRKHRSRVLA